MPTTWTISTGDWAVAAQDPEGYPIARLVHFVTATNDDGQVYKHFRAFDSPERAEALADRVRASRWGASGPVGSKFWSFFRIVYGSPYYARHAPRLEAETELAERTPELGPQGAYASLPDVMKAALGE